jgi:hypothetical protein
MLVISLCTRAAAGWHSAGPLNCGELIPLEVDGEEMYAVNVVHILNALSKDSRPSSMPLVHGKSRPASALDPSALQVLMCSPASRLFVTVLGYSS